MVLHIDNKIEVATKMLNVAKCVIDLKSQFQAEDVRKTVYKEINTNQIEKFGSLSNLLEPFFNKQIESASIRLSEMSGSKGFTTDDQATRLADQIHTSVDWNQELLELIVPFWINTSIEVMRVQTLLTSMDSSKGFDRTKLSTASELLLQQLTEGEVEDEDTKLITLASVLGTVNILLSTEYPNWMQEEIQSRLTETFSQPYWEDVNKTTTGDIEQYLRDGIAKGQSIETMAKNMVPNLVEEGIYGKRRGRRIARTESGHALNAARTRAINQVIVDTAQQRNIRRGWLSVLADTTRDAHADLDGVPEDGEGLWNLNGVMVRWPADVNLPAEDRVNCLCTVMTMFGMTSDTANQLIEEHSLRTTEELEA